MSVLPPGAAFVELDLAVLAARLPAARPDRPVLVAVDGRSSGGKTSLSARLAGALPRAAVVHTDDLAWHHAVLDWTDLLVDGVLAPVRAGREVRFRPPAWQERAREGAVVVPAGLSHLLVEGVGIARAAHHDLFDARLWVETPTEARVARDRERLAAGEMGEADYRAWMAEEDAHVAADRAWERADAVVDGAFEGGTDRVRVAFPRG